MMDEMTSARADELLRTPQTEREQTDSEIMDAWCAWLYETHGAEMPENVLHAVYSKAWDDGHAYGLQDVEAYFVELIELAEKIRAAS